MKLYIEDNETIPASVVLPDGSSGPSGFSMSNSIVDWENYGYMSISIDKPGWRDRLSLRSKIRELSYAKMGASNQSDTDDPSKWDLLTPDEKSVVAHYFLVRAESNFLEVVNDLDYWMIQSYNYDQWAKEARAQRLNLMRSCVFMRAATVEAAKSILQEMTQAEKDSVVDIDGTTKALNQRVLVKQLDDQYVKGIEGSDDNGNGYSFTGLRDFIESKTGTPFENHGLLQRPDSDFQGSHTSASVSGELVERLNGTW